MTHHLNSILFGETRVGQRQICFRFQHGQFNHSDEIDPTEDDFNKSITESCTMSLM